jgi:hypothetical protein
VLTRQMLWSPQHRMAGEDSVYPMVVEFWGNWGNVMSMGAEQDRRR